MVIDRIVVVETSQQLEVTPVHGVTVGPGELLECRQIQHLLESHGTGG